MARTLLQDSADNPDEHPPDKLQDPEQHDDKDYGDQLLDEGTTTSAPTHLFRNI
jgi:hypothetical protein